MLVDEQATEDKGREITKSIKVGTKMSAERETGYEPSLLIEMEKIFVEGTGKYVRRASVIKDRFGAPPHGIDSKQFDNPKFADLLPHIKNLNLGGDHVGVDAETSVNMFQSPDTSWTERQKAQAVYTEEIEGELVSNFPGQTTVEKKLKADILEVVFDSRSWTNIKGFAPERLQKGLGSIKQLCQIARNAIDNNEAVSVPWLRGELLRWTQRLTVTMMSLTSSRPQRKRVSRPTGIKWKTS